jgi:hypothetical protein
MEAEGSATCGVAMVLGSSWELCILKVFESVRLGTPLKLGERRLILPKVSDYLPCVAQAPYAQIGDIVYLPSEALRVCNDVLMNQSLSKKLR